MNDEPAPDDLDLLMSIDPLELSTEPGTEGRRKLDAIIAQQRKYRALREQGVKTRKPRMEAPAAIPLENLLASMPKPAPTGPAMKRRF